MLLRVFLENIVDPLLTLSELFKYSLEYVEFVHNLGVSFWELYQSKDGKQLWFPKLIVVQIICSQVITVFLILKEPPQQVHAARRPIGLYFLTGR